MKSPAKTSAPLKLIDQHDYISLVHANWRFTISYGGERASGILASDKDGFSALVKHVDAQRKAGATNGDIMKGLTDPKVMDGIWPAWSRALVLPTLVAGDTVRVLDAEVAFKKKYPGTYAVVGVTKKYATLALPDGRCGIPLAWLEKV